MTFQWVQELLLMMKIGSRADRSSKEKLTKNVFTESKLSVICVNTVTLF